MFQALSATVKKKRLLVPREHGAWGMLLIPFLIGASVAGQWGMALLLMLGAALSLYFTRYPLVLWARSSFHEFPADGWPTFIFGLAHGLFLGTLLMVRYELWLLIPIGMVGLLLLLFHLYLISRRQERTEVGEFAGFSALTLTAPAAFYASSGILSPVAFLLWLLCTLYFGTSVYYVKMRLADRFPQGNSKSHLRARLARGLALYQAMALGCAIALAYFQLVPSLTFLAFLPLTVHTLAGIFRPNPHLNIRKLGFTLVGHSVAFGLILILVFLTSPVSLPS